MLLTTGLDGEVIMVDVTFENTVVVISDKTREEGTPESALAFAQRIRRSSPEMIVVAECVEDAARLAIRRREKKAPKPS